MQHLRQHRSLQLSQSWLGMGLMRSEGCDYRFEPPSSPFVEVV